MFTINPFTGPTDELFSLLRVVADAERIEIPIYLGEPVTGTLVACRANGELIGVAHLPDDPTPEASLAVLPDHRRRGVGRALIAALLTEARARGLLRILLVTDAASPAARPFLAAIGAQPDFSEHRLTLDRARIKRPTAIPGLLLRPAAPDELDTLVRLRATAFDEDPEATRASILRRWHEPGRRYLIGELDGEPIGLLRTGPWEDGADITSFGVLPERQGRGYGRRMLLDAIDLLTAEGFGAIAIEVETTNDHALGLYRSCGFQVTTTFNYVSMQP